MTSLAPRVALLDYGSGNLRSAHRALERVGARVELTSDPGVATEADALVVPGVGAFAACMEGLRAVKGPRIIGERLAGGRPVLGICVGMQVMFERGTEFSDGEHPESGAAGCGEWPGVVERLEAPVLPHMGWNTVEAPERSVLFSGMPADERFYFVHSYGVQRWAMEPSDHLTPPEVTWARHGTRFVAAVENGPLSATQFHPEKSGDAGLHLLENWIRSLG